MEKLLLAAESKDTFDPLVSHLQWVVPVLNCCMQARGLLPGGEACMGAQDTQVLQPLLSLLLTVLKCYAGPAGNTRQAEESNLSVCLLMLLAALAPGEGTSARRGDSSSSSSSSVLHTSGSASSLQQWQLVPLVLWGHSLL